MYIRTHIEIATAVFKQNIIPCFLVHVWIQYISCASLLYMLFVHVCRERPQAIGLVSEDGEEGEGGALLGILELDNEVDVSSHVCMCVRMHVHVRLCLIYVHV